MTEGLLAEALSEMTPFERPKYEQSLYQIDVSLYPSVEQPVQIRIDGVDDGAEVALFGDMDSAEGALRFIATRNTPERRQRYGFKAAD